MEISKVCHYIRENIDQNLSLDQLALHFGYSKFHLSRTFKQQTGYSYKQYVEALKIERSIVSILNTEGSSKDAFIDSYHESTGTFSNTFKKLTGLSPNLYRRSLAPLGKTLMHVIKHKGLVVYRNTSAREGGKVYVNLHYPDVHTERVSFIGLFKNAIPNSAPVVGVALYKQTNCVLDCIPKGSYYLLVTEIDLTADIANYFWLNMNYRAKLDEQVHIYPHTEAHIDLNMRLSLPEDPPIVVNLPLLVKQALSK